MNKRQSNFELLRIVSMLLIIMFHYVYKGGFSYPETLTGNKLLLKSFWFIGELGVNLFVLITGYFQVTGSFKAKKLVLLIAEVLFYHLFDLTLLSLVGEYAFPIANKDRLLLLFPITQNHYWFATGYVLLYILSPYLNILIHAMNRNTFRRLLLTLLVLYSVIPTFFGVFYDNTEIFLFYNRFIWMIVVYLTGAYLRLYPCAFLNSRKKAAALSIITFLVMVLSVWVINSVSYIQYMGTREVAYFWPPNTLPMFLLSVGVFSIFRQLQVPHSSVVNRLASTTLGVYLLHDGPHLWWLWAQFGNASHQDSPWLVPYILRDACIVFLAAAVIDLLRQFLEKYTLQKLLDWAPVRKVLRRLDSTPTETLP